jgi:hypothetical protein
MVNKKFCRLKPVVSFYGYQHLHILLIRFIDQTSDFIPNFDKPLHDTIHKK